MKHESSHIVQCNRCGECKTNPDSQNIVKESEQSTFRKKGRIIFQRKRIIQGEHNHTKIRNMFALCGGLGNCLVITAFLELQFS